MKQALKISNPSARRLLIIGDSHVLMVKHARNKVPDLLAGFDCDVFQLSKVKGGKVHGEIHINDAVILAGELSPSDILVSVVGGSLFHQLSLVQHSQPFSLSSMSSISETGDHIIPRNLFKAALKELMVQREIPNLTKLAQAAPCPVLHVCGVPPRSTADINMDAFKNKFPGISEYGLSNDALRLEAWRVQTDIQKEACKSLNARFLPPPLKAMTEGGFIRPKLFATDTTHANVGYGIYVLSQIIAAVPPLSSASLEDKGLQHVAPL